MVAWTEAVPYAEKYELRASFTADKSAVLAAFEFGHRIRGVGLRVDFALRAPDLSDIEQRDP